ncbi:MAG: hypothetical protein ACLTDR_14680 [Adlercreutzia equolifaciens]
MVPGIDPEVRAVHLEGLPARHGSGRRPITSQTRILMNHAVYSDTPTWPPSHACTARRPCRPRTPSTRPRAASSGRAARACRRRR